MTAGGMDRNGGARGLEFVRLIERLLVSVVFWTMFLSGSALALEPAQPIAQFKHSAWSAELGAPAGVQALAQTPDGFLWVGGDTGLFRFDGIRFERISPRRVALLDEEPVSALLTARNGDLWVGFQSGHIAILRHGVWIDRSFHSSIGYIQSFLEDRSGNIWALNINRQRPVIRYGQGRWLVLDQKWGVKIGAIDFLAEAADGSVWLADRHGIMTLPRGGNGFRSVVGVDQRVGRLEFTGFATGPRGDVWNSGPSAGTRRIFDPAHRDATVLATPTIPVRTRKHSKRVFIFDRNGAIWGVTYSAGVYRIDQPQALYAGGAPTEEIFSAKDGLTSDYANAVLEDREGNIWVGTNGGLDRFRRANIVAETGIPPLSRYSYAMLSATDGAVYIADSDRLFRIPAGGKAQVVLKSLDNPQGLCAGPDGTVWLMAYNGFYRTVGGRFVRMPQPSETRAYFSCVVSNDGHVWLNPVNGGLLRYDQGRWDNVPGYQGKAPPLVQQMISAPEGGILAYLRAGPLIRIDDRGAHVVWKAKDIPDGGITAFYASGNKVLAATATGLVLYAGGRVAELRRDYPWLHGVAGMVDSRDGNIWISSRTGIIRLAWSDLDRSFSAPGPVLRPTIFSYADGLSATVRTGLPSAAARGGDGRLWFVTTDGVARIDPAHLNYNPLPPPVIVTALAYGGTRLRDPTAVTLPAGTARLAIDYTALSLAMAEGVRFRYRLEGVDKEWVNPGTQREAIYTNLSPGNYRFRVIAANHDGVWNRTGASLALTLPPTFLQSPWFKLMGALVLVALVWAAYQLRIRQITARLRTRFEGRISERERIARELHDTLLQGVQGLVLHFQAAAKRLASGRPAQATIEEALLRADAVLTESRERVHELRRTTGHGNLADSWVAIATEFASLSPSEFEITVEGGRRRLHPMVFEELQRIGEEALRNAFQHAHAQKIDVTLSYRGRDLLLLVRDDGAGLPSDVLSTGERKGHYGLTGMRERARRIGGTLSIVSRAGVGTELSLSVPARAAYADRSARWWMPAATRAEWEQ